MSYRGIKRVLGESSLERKIRVLFGICLLLLIAGSFLWVNRITENLIRRNTRDKARGLKPDFILRTHLRNQMFTEDEKHSRTLFESLATEDASTPYRAEPIVLDDRIGRHQLHPIVASDPNEIERLRKLLPQALEKQNEQNKLEIRKRYGEAKATPPPPVDPASSPQKNEEVAEVDFTYGHQYVYYTPLIFNSKSECMRCHFPVAKEGEKSEALERIARQFRDSSDTEEQKKLDLERFSLAPPVFLRITLDNQISKGAITKNRAILISVAIVTSVLSVAAIWLIVRYVIVKPLAHLRDVTEQISHGRLDVRAELNTGDEFEDLSRSFNRMLRHLIDTQLALQNANTDLDKKFDEQARLALELYEMNQVKSEFLANMSHELRTPLNSIIGFSEILENAPGLDDRQTRFASNIRNSGRLLLDLINDILDLAKLEAGEMEIKPSHFSIRQLCNELCEMVRNLAERKNIQLTTHADDDLPELYQDKVKVRQILTNLLSNAIKFTPEGGRIQVKVTRNSEDQLVIEVSDTGVGIAESDQQIIFEKFRQGTAVIGKDALTREVSGTGLGLSIVKELCILLGGHVSLESEVGKGSRFTVTLPIQAVVKPKVDSAISQTLNEITKPSRIDFARTNQLQPPDASDFDEGESQKDAPNQEPSPPSN